MFVTAVYPHTNIFPSSMPRRPTSNKNAWIKHMYISGIVCNFSLRSPDKIRALTSLSFPHKSMNGEHVETNGYSRCNIGPVVTGNIDGSIPLLPRRGVIFDHWNALPGYTVHPFVANNFTALHLLGHDLWQIKNSVVINGGAIFIKGHAYDFIFHL